MVSEIRHAQMGGPTNTQKRQATVWFGIFTVFTAAMFISAIHFPLVFALVFGIFAAVSWVTSAVIYSAPPDEFRD